MLQYPYLASCSDDSSLSIFDLTLSASVIAMRALVLAAITMIFTAHALPRPDLAASQGADDLRNTSHIFHHFDRNQRTANRDREPMHEHSTDGPGLYAVKGLQDKPQQVGRWSMARERAVDRRFMQDPDYSEVEGSQGGSNSGSPASYTMPTQQPPAKAENQGEMANDRGRS